MLALVVVGIAVAIAFVSFVLRTPYQGYAGEEVIVTIAPRTPSATVFEVLESKGVLRDWRLGMVGGVVCPLTGLAIALVLSPLLNQLGGGCQVPIGAYAVLDNGQITLTGVCARPDGSELIREAGTGSDPVELGQRIGNLILSRGGDRILRDVYSENAAGAPAGA